MRLYPRNSVRHCINHNNCNPHDPTLEKWKKMEGWMDANVMYSEVMGMCVSEPVVTQCLTTEPQKIVSIFKSVLFHLD